MNDDLTGELDELLIEVRAGTRGFAADVQAMRTTLDSTLVDGFAKAGQVLESGLLGAVRKGSLSFADLQRTAIAALDAIAAHALRSGLDAIFGGGGGGGIGSLGGTLGGSLTALLGLPGRATGGPVAPGRGYLVGERGPELFVPTSAGRVEASAPSSRREVRVSISLPPERGTAAPVALQRSSRQVASAVRRALS